MARPSAPPPPSRPSATQASLARARWLARLLSRAATHLHLSAWSSVSTPVASPASPFAPPASPVAPPAAPLRHQPVEICCEPASPSEPHLCGGLPDRHGVARPLRPSLAASHLAGRSSSARLPLRLRPLRGGPELTVRAQGPPCWCCSVLCRSMMILMMVFLDNYAIAGPTVAAPAAELASVPCS